VIEIEEVALPEPGDDDVLVRVDAAGVGPWDALIRSGQSAVAQPLPLTLGSDLAGTVEAVGKNENELRPGDAVFGVTNARFVGAYAEYALADRMRVALMPKSLDAIAAASVPVVAVTAWRLLELAHVAAGSRVLVHGAAGSVGGYVVQLARRSGAHVIANVSPDEDAYVRSLGAADAIDGRNVPLSDAVQPVDAVVDLVGGDVQRQSFALVRPGGYLVSPVTKPNKDEARSRGINVDYLLVDVERPRLAEIAALFAEGALQACVGAVLELAQAREAHQMLAGTRSHPRGKIVLRVQAP